MTPSGVLQKYINAYQTNPYALSKALGVAYQTVTFILKEKSKLSPKMAVRLAKHFGNKPEYWLDIQASADLAELSADKKFQSSLKNITIAQKSKSKAKVSKKKAKTVKIKASKGKTAKKRGRQATSKKK